MKKLLTVFMVILMVLTCVACGGKEEQGSAVNNDADGNGKVDKLVVAQAMSYTTLTPFLNAKLYTSAVHECLGAKHSYGSGFEGLLMESWEYDGDRSYTIKLFNNIHDSNNNVINADDVVFCYEVAKTVGETTSRVSPLESVTKVDDLTVKMTWKEVPTLGSFELITSLITIVDKDEFEKSGDNMASHPVGVGPYKVESWTSGAELVLVPNENYWATGNQIKFEQQRQPVDRIEVQVITETSQHTMALQTETVDVTDGVTYLDISQFEDGGAYSDKYDVYSMTAYSGNTIMTNNSETSPLHDYNLRMAIAHAIDRENLAKSINGGACLPLYGLGAPANADYDADAFKASLPEYSLDKAKEYLAKSAYPNGCELKYVYIDGMGINKDLAELIQNQLGKIGITVKTEGKTFPNFITDQGKAETWDLLCAPLSSNDYCVSIWDGYFNVNRTGTGATKNFIVDSELQALVEGCTHTDNHTQENVNKCWDYIAKNVYSIPLVVTKTFTVYDNTLIKDIYYSGEGALCPTGFIYY